MMLLAPLPEEQWDDTVRAALAGMVARDRQNAESAGNALSTLLHHPALTKAFLAFNIHLLFRSTLPERLRELAILRVAARSESAYEWAHHVMLGANVGLTQEEMDAAGRGEAADEIEAAVLRAVDEYDVDSRISEQTWIALGAGLDERQRMDLLFTIGGYKLLSVAFNTFGVEPEHER